MQVAIHYHHKYAYQSFPICCTYANYRPPPHFSIQACPKKIERLTCHDIKHESLKWLFER